MGDDIGQGRRGEMREGKGRKEMGRKRRGRIWGILLRDGDGKGRENERRERREEGEGRENEEMGKACPNNKNRSRAPVCNSYRCHVEGMFCRGGVTS